MYWGKPRIIVTNDLLIGMLKQLHNYHVKSINCRESSTHINNIKNLHQFKKKLQQALKKLCWIPLYFLIYYHHSYNTYMTTYTNKLVLQKRLLYILISCYEHVSITTILSLHTVTEPENRVQLSRRHSVFILYYYSLWQILFTYNSVYCYLPGQHVTWKVTQTFVI